MATDFPGEIVPGHSRDSSGPPSGTAAFFVLGALMVAALAGLFGGNRSATHTVANRTAELAVKVPGTLRSGMLFETDIKVTARAPIEDATVTMSRSLWRSITINTEMPQPAEEEFADGSFRLHYGALEPGDRLTVKLDAQINPDLFAGNRGEVALFDGERAIVRLPVAVRVLP